MPYASPIADHRPGLARRPHSHSGNITFSNERSGPGAHAPLPVLPRRASKGAIFQLTEEQEHSSPDDSPALPLFAADEDDDYPPPLQLKKGNIASSFKHPGLGLRVDTDSRNGSPVGGGSPMGAVPFPRLSPQPAASSPVLLQTSASMGHIRQGSDAPLVRKSNGQLLKSSLKVASFVYSWSQQYSLSLSVLTVESPPSATTPTKPVLLL